MNRHLAAAAATIAFALTATAVMAQADPIKERKTLLKEFGDDTHPLADMMKGQKAFDLAAVQKALDAYVKNVKELPNLFPEGTDKGGDTEALPAIWKNKTKFDDLYVKLGTDATAARAAITDEASFKKNFPAVVKNCGACHDDFRQKKN